MGISTRPKPDLTAWLRVVALPTIVIWNSANCRNSSPTAEGEGSARTRAANFWKAPGRQGAAHGLCQIVVKPIHIEIGRSPIDAYGVTVNGHVARMAGSAGQAQVPSTARYFNGIDGKSDREDHRV